MSLENNKSKNGYNTGRLTKVERKYIRQNPSLSTDVVAEHLNRRPHPIIRYRKKLATTKRQGGQNKESYEFDLENHPIYSSLKRQFRPHELEFFKFEWSKIWAQFKGDVLATEEIQIISLIQTCVLLNRNGEASKESAEQIERVVNILEGLYKIPEKEREVHWLDRVANLEQQLAGLRNSSKVFTDEKVKLEQTKSTYLAGLNATREQRKKNVIDSASNWSDLVKKLTEKESREHEGRQAALMEKAARKERERLSQLHTFLDGEVDSPLLNFETHQFLEEGKEEKEDE